MTALCNMMLNPVKAASREAGYKRKAERVLVSSRFLLQFIQVKASYKKKLHFNHLLFFIKNIHTGTWGHSKSIGIEKKNCLYQVPHHSKVQQSTVQDSQIYHLLFIFKSDCMCSLQLLRPHKF